ncbi:MAG TPA: hypothetical protein VEC76_19750 [Streptosporangiaceae bacterium]|nr:hypothetical protein [Streptosporangiaceae bacterium]
MVGGSSKVIARIFSTHESEYASLTWEWAIRADGEVRYRLRELRGRRERNPWRSVAQLSRADLRALSENTVRAEAWLASLARERGHHVNGYRGR